MTELPQIPEAKPLDQTPPQWTNQGTRPPPASPNPPPPPPGSPKDSAPAQKAVLDFVAVYLKQCGDHLTLPHALAVKDG